MTVSSARGLSGHYLICGNHEAISTVAGMGLPCLGCNSFAVAPFLGFLEVNNGELNMSYYHRK
jgi:hypothetical protein